MCPCQECGLLTPEELCTVAPAGRGAAEVQRGAVARQVLGSVAQQMDTLGLKPRGSLVWMVHCGKTRVSDQQLAAWSKIGGAIAPEKVRLRLPGAPCQHLHGFAPSQLASSSTAGTTSRTRPFVGEGTLPDSLLRSLSLMPVCVAVPPHLTEIEGGYGRSCWRA